MRGTLALAALVFTLSAASASAATPLAHCNFAAKGGLCGSVTVPLDRSQPSGQKIDIKFVVFKHTDTKRAPLGTIFVTSGGPGDSAINRRQDAYRQYLFAPLLSRRDLVLIDQRGVGQSGAIDCKQLQQDTTEVGSYDAVASCASQLGSSAFLYGSADVAADIEAVRAALGVEQFDFYGASGAGVDVQAYAARFPDRLRSAVLDSPQVLSAEDPWVTSGAAQAVQAVRLVCLRSASCSAANRDPAGDVAWLARRLRRRPLHGVGHDAVGVARRVTVTEALFSNITGSDAAGYINQGDVAAAAAALRHGDPVPLLRLAAETAPSSSGGNADKATDFSRGDGVARWCVDQTFQWNNQASREERQAQFDAARSALPPDQFAPFSVDGWVVGPPLGALPDTCIAWPAPTGPLAPAVPPGSVVAGVPALILTGDLDLNVPASESAQLTQMFPRSTLVNLAESGHHTAFNAQSECSIALILRFVRTLGAGDTRCARRIGYVFPAVGRFPVNATRDRHGRVLRRSAARITGGAVVDSFRRSFLSDGPKPSGAGLRGGTFQGRFTDSGETLHLRGVRYARDLAISGAVRYVQYQRLRGRLAVKGAVRGTLHVRGTWNSPGATRLTVAGRLGGRRVKVTIPAT
jgi:pimeloyl-ACP methyl ester carboxylesterase